MNFIFLQSYGEFEGKSEAEVKELAKKHNFVYKNYVPKGGESVQQLAKRAVEFFDHMCKNLLENAEHGETLHDDGKSLESRVEEASSSASVANVLIACHGGTIRQLFYHFARDIPSEFLCEGKDQIWKLCPNTGVSRFEVFVSKTTRKAEFIRCTMLYDGSHLTNKDERILYEEHAL